MTPTFKAPVTRFVRMAPAWMLRAGLRALPGSSQRWGPPRRFTTIQELAAESRCDWYEAYPAMESKYPPPIALREDLQQLRQFRSVTWAPTGVARVPGARLLTEHALPVTDRDEFMMDATWNDGRPVVEAILTRGTGRIDRRKGAALNLGSTWASVNYGHFVLDTFPRLRLFERIGGCLDKVDWVVVPSFNSTGAQRIIDGLGLRGERIIRPRRNTQLAFDEVWQPSYPCANQARHYPPWVPEFYRERMPFPNGASRRLYLTRGQGRRSVANEAELEPWLRRHGFEMVSMAKVANGPELMASAEVVIAPHGAALADLVFCRPGTTVLELVPPRWLLPYYYSVAVGAGLRYHALIGDPAPDTDRRLRRFRVDPIKFERLAEQAMAEVRGPGAGTSTELRDSSTH